MGSGGRKKAKGACQKKDCGEGAFPNKVKTYGATKQYTEADKERYCFRFEKARESNPFLTQAEFASSLGLNEAAFGRWLKEFRKGK